MKVINVHPYDNARPNNAVYIGRGTPYGNPFKIGKDGNRATVIQKYKEYLLANNYLKEQVKELKGKTLMCHCAPEACHGDIIIDFLKENP
jgi:hypothetical protein